MVKTVAKSKAKVFLVVKGKAMASSGVGRVVLDEADKVVLRGLDGSRRLSHVVCAIGYCASCVVVVVVAFIGFGALLMSTLMLKQC